MQPDLHGVDSLGRCSLEMESVMESTLLRACARSCTHEGGRSSARKHDNESDQCI